MAAAWGVGHNREGEGLRPDLSWKSLPEQRPNAAGAKAESREALEVTAEKETFRGVEQKSSLDRFLPPHQREMASRKMQGLYPKIMCRKTGEKQ